jgi:hypothetical protein
MRSVTSSGSNIFDCSLYRLDTPFLGVSLFRQRCLPWLSKLDLIFVVVIPDLDVVIVPQKFAVSRPAADIDPLTIIRDITRNRSIFLDVTHHVGASLTLLKIIVTDLDSAIKVRVVPKSPPHFSSVRRISQLSQPYHPNVACVHAKLI